MSGGGSGIGKGIARMLADEGFFVYVVDVDGERATLTAKEIEGVPIVIDVGDQSSVVEFFSKIRKDGGIDTLVNSAAVISICPILDMTAEVWNNVLRVNLSGALWCSQEAAKIMKEKLYGRIVNISSINGSLATSGRGAYSVSKAGLDMLTKLFALELAEYGITTNGISPSLVDTPMVRVANKDGEMLGLWKNRLPITRFASVAEVVSVVRFLVGEDASYVNGATINVDGGFCSTGLKI